VRLNQIIQLLSDHGQVALSSGESDETFLQVAALSTATKSQISFFSDPKRKGELEDTRAGLVLMKQEHEALYDGLKLIVENPYYCYALVSRHLNPPKLAQHHPEKAAVSDLANLARDVLLGAFVVIEDHVVIGDGTSIGAGTFIGQGVCIGNDCLIQPNVTIMHDCVIGEGVTIESGSVIGGEGFGNANHQGEWFHIPQLGRVLVGDGAWIGNNCTIDRGSLEDTIIEANCVIDNLVHIAHNVQIGYGSAIAGQVGFAGSAKVGQYCTFGGQAGVAGHLSLADNTHYFAKAGVTHSINQSGVYSGFPAVPVKEWQKTTVKVKGLSKLSAKVKALDQKVAQLSESDTVR